MDADDSPRAPPRRPGEVTARNLRITANVRWGLALLGLALVLIVLTALQLFRDEVARVVGDAAFVTFLLGGSALAHAAHSAWRGRRR